MDLKPESLSPKTWRPAYRTDPDYDKWAGRCSTTDCVGKAHYAVGAKKSSRSHSFCDKCVRRLAPELQPP